MEQSAELTALEREVGRIDPEVFRRVWARVMPDQSNSPLVVQGASPQGGPKGRNQPPAGEHKARRSPAPDRDPAAQRSPSTVPGGGEALARLMDLAREGAERGTALARRTGNRERGLSALAGDHRQSARRLAALYFLATGQRRQPRTPPPEPVLPLDLALREQFLWEGRWQTACLEAAGETTGGEAELCRALAGEAERHRRTIREILERM